MDRALKTGTRIRSYRIDKGLRQAVLAEMCDISPSYLNLIEHNRRNIGGTLLVRIADVLGVAPTVLTDGAGAALTASLESVANAYPQAGAERLRAEEFAARFPGWAKLIDLQQSEIQRLEDTVEQLRDRLTHDPFLSASMHTVLSSVTAIRSASAILAKGEQIEPEWEARFRRNIFEESQRLADATETLVAHLDLEHPETADAAVPKDEEDFWLG
ncbi:MAG: helix-turn-helix domain-containing protein [Pseudomonadota bacterium]